jgi:RND superfamily putative drug exporter
MGRWSARHWKTATFGWLALVAVALVLGMQAGTKELTDADAMTGESARAERILEQAGFDRPAQEYVLVQARGAAAAGAELETAAAEVVEAVTATGLVENVRSPFAAGNEGQISADGRSALVQFDVKGDSDDADRVIGRVLEAVAGVQAAHPELAVEEYGLASSMKALDETVGADFKRAELLSIPLTLGILIVAFGALLAAFVPVVLALSAFVGALGLLAFASRAFPVDDAAGSVMLLIGLAVGVDYSLFYIKREREERAAGKGPEAALEAAAATSGRSVLISGLTVIVAMAGMFFAGGGTFTGIAVATILVVAMAVLGSLTVLPALLSKLGDRIERGRVPLVSRLRREDGEGRVWGWVLDRALRRPVLAVAVAGGVLAALAVPAFGIHTSLPGADDLPQNLPVIQTYNKIQGAFPGGPAPARIVVTADDVTSPAVVAAFEELRSEGLASGWLQEPIQVDVNPSGTVAVVSAPLAGAGAGDATSDRALEALRTELLPAALAGTSGVEAVVTGEIAASKDFNDTMKSRAPIVFAFVLALAFVLLFVAFRSIVIAVKAIVLNLLSVAAAYGLLVLLFQKGWGESFLGFESTGAIASWLPLFLFVVLFGLSMDYHVFIVSRIREAYDRGLGTEEAVAHGIKTTAGVVTAAAVVMVAVFSIFATLSQVSMKETGVGLAAAVLIDATIVRAVLLPAAMKLLGRWNWYLPRWLDWLPRLEHEAPAAAAALAPAGK